MENKLRTAVIKAIAVFAVIVMVICAVPAASLSGLDGGIVTVASAAETSDIYTYTVEDKKATIISIDSEATGDIKIPSKLGGYPVTAIDDMACILSFGITSIAIPDSVEKIGDLAFASCMELKSVTIGKGLKKIVGNPFYGCEALKTIKISKDNPYFVNDDKGIVFNKDKTKLLICPSAAAIFDYTVPDTVKSIGDAAFAYNSYLRSVTIPASVSSIGEEAFTYCEKLKTVTATESLYKMGADAFIETLWFNSFKDEMVYLGSVVCGYSGENAPSEIIIKDGTKGIAGGAFATILGTEEIYIPDSVIYIGDLAFVTEVERFTVGANNSKFMSDSSGVIYSKDQKKLIAYPVARAALTYTVSDKTEEIGENAFAFSTYLEQVTLPSSVRKIGDAAFSLSERLTKISLSKNITDLGEGTFSFCSSLESIKIPDGVKTIEDGTFSWCTSLASVKFGKSLTKIDNAAFANCSSLTKITLPESLKTIGKGAFSGCTALKYFRIDDSNKYFSVDAYGALLNKKATKLIAYPAGRTKTVYSVPKTVTTIGTEAFAYCSNLKTVSLSEKTKTIGESAFLFCDKIESIALHKVSTIKDEAFYGCENLENVYLSTKIKTIGEAAFDGCYELSDIYYSGTKQQWKKVKTDKYDDGISQADKNYSHKHTYNKGKTASKATYLREGFKLYTCSECGGVKTTVIPKLKLAKGSAVSLKSAKKAQAVFSWKPVSEATGYIISYSTSKDFSSEKTKKVTVEGQKTSKRTLKKLKSGKKYYVRVRAYKVVDGKTVYGSYSKAISVKVK